MVNVNIDKILPVTEVRDSLNKIIDEVETTDEMYVVTKNGKPSAIIVGVHHLEKLTGIKSDELTGEAKPEEKQEEDTTKNELPLIPEIAPIKETSTETPAIPIPATDSSANLSNASAPSVTTIPIQLESTVEPAKDDALDSIFDDNDDASTLNTQNTPPTNLMSDTPAPVANNTQPEVAPVTNTISNAQEPVAPVLNQPQSQAQPTDNQAQTSV